jgi:hypothetical protein
MSDERVYEFRVVNLFPCKRHEWGVAALMSAVLFGTRERAVSLSPSSSTLAPRPSPSGMHWRVEVQCAGGDI